MLLTTYKLTQKYALVVCDKNDKNDENALRGDNFICNKDWVIEEGIGEIYPTSYKYHTLSSKRFNLPLIAKTPKEAIEQILIYAYTGKAKKLKEMYFKIVINNDFL